MISLATVMSNPVRRTAPRASPSLAPCPTVMSRSMRSHVSITRRHVMLEGSMSSLSWGVGVAWRG